MPLDFDDTIAARATPPGYGGVGIIRISGKCVSNVANAILGKLPKPRHAAFCHFLDDDGQMIDQGIALYFKAPHSFTGEDILELHGHGGPLLLDQLLQRILQLNVRMARPGEFSERAFLNEKIDLTQAEAIADLIEASSIEAARSAIRSLQGHFSREIRSLVNQVIRLRMYVEAAIDFPDEDVDFLSDGKILTDLNLLLSSLEGILIRAKQGSVLKEGLKVVIAGYPNAGKSSLLNSLSGESTAIVSDIPGTTRDIIKEDILIGGLRFFLLDTAGLRDTTIDAIELEGVKRAWEEIPQADRILLVVDAETCPVRKLPQHELVRQLMRFKERLTIVRNKIDLLCETENITEIDGVAVVNLSIQTGLGLDLLKTHLKELSTVQHTENVIIARRRHIEALQTAQRHFYQAREQLTTYHAGELVAEELRDVQLALNQITGEFRTDDLLGEIFSSFCIGK
jgi:tRNA modification GTPase